MPSSDPQHALVRAVLDGDAEAVDRLYRSEHPTVHRLCFGFLADEAEADDAAQDALLHLLDRLRSWDPTRSWPAWRNAVVLNHCRDRLRRRQTRRQHEDGAAELSLPGVLPRPDEAAQAAEVQAILRAALANLSPREREAFVLRDLEGRPTDETAGSMGVSPSSVRSLLTLARRRLRGLLGSRLPELAGPGPVGGTP